MPSSQLGAEQSSCYEAHATSLIAHINFDTIHRAAKIEIILNAKSTETFINYFFRSFARAHTQFSENLIYVIRKIF